MKHKVFNLVFCKNKTFLLVYFNFTVELKMYFSRNRENFMP